MLDLIRLLFDNFTNVLMGLFITLIMIYLFIHGELPDYLQTLLISIVMYYIGNVSPTIFSKRITNGAKSDPTTNL